MSNEYDIFAAVNEVCNSDILTNIKKIAEAAPDVLKNCDTNVSIRDFNNLLKNAPIPTNPDLLKIKNKSETLKQPLSSLNKSQDANSKIAASKNYVSNLTINNSNLSVNSLNASPEFNLSDFSTLQQDIELENEHNSSKISRSRINKSTAKNRVPVKAKNKTKSTALRTNSVKDSVDTTRASNERVAKRKRVQKKSPIFTSISSLDPISLECLNVTKNNVAKTSKKSLSNLNDISSEPMIETVFNLTGRITRSISSTLSNNMGLNESCKEPMPSTLHAKSSTQKTNSNSTSKKPTRRNVQKRKSTQANNSVSSAVSVDLTGAPYLEPLNSDVVNQNEKTSIYHKQVMRARRDCLAEKALHATQVDYIDLVTSPSIPITGVVTVDSDEEIASSTVDKNAKLFEGSFNEENPEIKVKINWEGVPEVFTLRKYHKFARIFKIIAEREKTCEDNLVFNIDNKIITKNDTPNSIDYKIFQFINGRAFSTKDMFSTLIDLPTDEVVKKSNGNSITLKIQSNKFKKPFLLELEKSDKFKILYIKCAEELNIEENKLRLNFDGDILLPEATPLEWDLEGDEAIDLHILP